jgi:cell division protein FtsW (lipid II flippase)
MAALAAGFVISGAIALYFAPFPTDLTLGHLIVLVSGWIVAWGGSYGLIHGREREVDPLILPIAALLTGWGLLLQARLAPTFMLRQVLWLILSCAAMTALVLTRKLSRVLRRYRYTLLTAGIFLLAATLVFGVNPSGFGQRLWLGARGIYIQPSEILKLLLVIYLASYLSERRDLVKAKSEGKSRGLIVLGPMLAMVGLALLLVGWQQDLGAALLFYLTFATMIHLAWGKPIYTLLSLLLFIPVVVAGSILSTRVAHRISIWLNPWAPEQADRAFQILQSLFALANGGLFGQGLGQGVPTLIPAVHTDFVFSALVEEFGLVGGIALILCLTALAQRGIRLARRSPSAFESLLAGGLTALISIQSWVIIGGNIKLVPITGVTLPYLSYGGSSLLTMLIVTGILLNLSAPHPPPLKLSLSPQTTPLPSVTVGHLGKGLLTMMLSLAIGSGVWSLARASRLNTYPSNPRPILQEARIQRGDIRDRNGDLLAGIAVDRAGYVERTYPVPEAAPVIGYVSIEHGTEGIESVCDARLRGEVNRTDWEQAVDRVLHREPRGKNVRLTIDAELQSLAQERMQGREGAVVLIDARTGDVLVMASAPTYASGSVAEDWESLRSADDAPLLNRATQGLTQPGMILAPIILERAWAHGYAGSPPQPLTSTIQINGDEIGCASAPETTSWRSALASQCPAPLARIGEALGPEIISDAFAAWGLSQSPQFALPAVSGEYNPTSVNAAEESIGQGSLLVTPLQAVRIIATLANDGKRVALHVIEEPSTGCDIEEPNDTQQVITAENAARLIDILPRHDRSIGLVEHALAGPDRVQSWFLGLNSERVPRYAVAILISQEKPSDEVIEIGEMLLERVTTDPTTIP